MKSRKKDKKSSRKNKSRHCSISEDDDLVYIPPRTEERLLIEQTASLNASKILCVSTGRAQLAGFLADQNPQGSVICHYLDTQHAHLAKEYWLDADAPPEIVCTPDFPEETFDVICMPTIQQGNAELTRELLQQAHQRLKLEGILYASSNNPTDKWLHEQLNKLFAKVTRNPQKTGTVYSARKTSPLKRERKFQAEFPIKISGQQLSFMTRPGVYSHRSVDDGTWALIKSLDIRPGMNVLDLGCGSGAVGIAAILAEEKGVRVTALDSHARAIDCTRKNAEANLSEEQLKRLTILQTHSLGANSAGKFDLVAINPPYFSHLTVAEAFISSAKKTLKKSGRILFVTKMPNWYEEHLPKFFRKVKIIPCGKYSIVQGRL